MYRDVNGANDVSIENCDDFVMTSSGPYTHKVEINRFEIARGQETRGFLKI